MDDGVRAGGVVADHAADVGSARGGDVGAEHQVVPGELAIERIEHDARLHAGDAEQRIDVENVVEIFAAIEHDAGSDRLAREAGAAAAWDDGDVHFESDLYRGLQAHFTLRNDDADRF